MPAVKNTYELVQRLLLIGNATFHARPMTIPAAPPARSVRTHALRAARGAHQDARDRAQQRRRDGGNRAQKALGIPIGFPEMPAEQGAIDVRAEIAGRRQIAGAGRHPHQQRPVSERQRRRDSQKRRHRRCPAEDDRSREVTEADALQHAGNPHRIELIEREGDRAGGQGRSTAPCAAEDAATMSAIATT